MLKPMHISWHGQYTLKMQSGETTIVIDPYAPNAGLSPFRSKAQFVALTNPSDPTMAHTAGITDEPVIIDAPGEYAMNGFTLQALGWHDDQGAERSLQRWQIEDIVLLHVGGLQREMTDKEMQELERTTIDILFVPVGGGSALSTPEALKLVGTIEPRIVIPIHFKLPGLTEKLDSVEQFAKEMGVQPKAHEKKLVIKRKNIPQDELATFILMP